MSHTYAVMEVSKKTFREIKKKLEIAEYFDAIQQDRHYRSELLDMHGIALSEGEVEEYTIKPAARENLSAKLIIKLDGETGSTHMTDREEWGRLMARKINAALKTELQARRSPTDDTDAGRKEG